MRGRGRKSGLVGGQGLKNQKMRISALRVVGISLTETKMPWNQHFFRDCVIGWGRCGRINVSATALCFVGLANGTWVGVQALGELIEYGV